MMTPEEVCQKLKIKPWKEHYAEVQKWKEKHLKNHYTPEKYETEKSRMTGRTTRMLVSLLCAVSAGLRVYVTAGSSLYGTILGHSAKHLANLVGLDESLILLHPAPGAVEFIDHSFWDRS